MFDPDGDVDSPYLDRMRACEFFAKLAEASQPNTILFDHECARAYAWQTIRERGITLAFSTDWPVVPVHVLANIQSAVAPLDLGPGWPDQRQSLMDTLRSYTAMNAWLGFQEAHTGQIRQGLAADLVVLDGSIEDTAPTQIGDLGVALTLCDGQVTYDGGRF